MTAQEIAEAMRAEAEELLEAARTLDPPRRGRPPVQDDEQA